MGSLSMPRKESEFYLVNFHQYSKFSLNDITVYLIYRPPSGGANSIDNLTALISAAERRSIFIGDFNLPEINWEVEWPQEGQQQHYWKRQRVAS